MEGESNKQPIDEGVQKPNTFDGRGTTDDNLKRRQFLQSAAATATVAGLGATAFSGQAAAGEKKCGESLDDAPWWYPWYDIENWEDHGFPWGEGELAIYINGWQSNYDRGPDQGFECRRAMEDAGYWGEVAGVHWHSETATWTGGKSKADDMGQNLAHLVSHLQDHGTHTIRLIGHSLGARVIGTCLNELRNNGRSVDSVALLGGAIESDSVGEDCGWWCTGEFYHAMRDAAGVVHNYYSHDDEVLSSLYRLAEWDAAVGEVGSEGGPPANFHDHDATHVVGSEHCCFYKRHCGIMDWVVDHY